jgi:hypothetical protein
MTGITPTPDLVEQGTSQDCEACQEQEALSRLASALEQAFTSLPDSSHWKSAVRGIREHVVASAAEDGATADETPKGPITPEDIDRAVAIVQAIRSIPTMREGVVGFGYGLQGGRWYWDIEEAHRFEEQIVASMAPPRHWEAAEIRAAIIEGVRAVKLEREAWRAECLSRGADDEVADWSRDIRAFELPEGVA